jgi:hypothetical protein
MTSLNIGLKGKIGYQKKILTWNLELTKLIINHYIKILHLKKWDIIDSQNVYYNLSTIKVFEEMFFDWWLILQRMLRLMPHLSCC